MSLVPKLRFPEYDGEWRDQKLKENILLISGQHLSPEEYSDRGEFPYFTGPTDFTDDTSKVKKWTATHRSVARSGSILITVKGSGVGEMAQNKLENVVIGRQLMSIEGKNASTEFLYQYLLKKRQLMKALASGNMIPGLSRADLISLSVSIPSLPEQQKIASFLSSVDKKIDLLRQKKDAFELYKKGLMQKIFSQEIRFKQDDGSDFPDWEEVALGDYSRFLITNSLSRSDLDTDGVVQNIHYGDIHTLFSSQYDQHVERTPYISDVKIASKLHSNNQLQRGDIVIADASEDYADIGKAIEIIRISETPLFAGLHTIAMRPDSNKFTVGFGSYLFQSTEVRRQIHRLAQGAKVLGLSKGNIQSLVVSLPCLHEQKKIAEFISALDRQSKKIVHIIEQMETFKKGLLQQMFV